MLDDLARLAVGLVQPVVSAEGVGLEDPGIVGQMRLSMGSERCSKVSGFNRAAAHQPDQGHGDRGG
jgi:hypothetical protein